MPGTLFRPLSPLSSGDSSEGRFAAQEGFARPSQCSALCSALRALGPEATALQGIWVKIRRSWVPATVLP